MNPCPVLFVWWVLILFCLYCITFLSLPLIFHECSLGHSSPFSAWRVSIEINGLSSRGWKEEYTLITALLQNNIINWKKGISLSPESPRSSQADYTGRSQQEVRYWSENYLSNMKTKARTEEFLNVGTKPHGKPVDILCDEVYCPEPNSRADPSGGIQCSEDIH